MVRSSSLVTSETFSQASFTANLSRVPAYNEIVGVLHRYADGQFFVAGGALRNICLSTTVNDVDFFISSKTLEVFLGDDLLKKGVLRAGPLGSPRWYADEITYFDFVAIEGVDHGFGGSKNIHDVLARFDFTGNALAFQPITGELLDPFLGSEDLKRRVMRAVRLDFVNERISADSPLTWRAALWLRLVHYSNALQLTIEPVTREWIVANRDCEAFANDFSAKFFVPKVR
jgi:Poly A polymerase head domain